MAGDQVLTAVDLGAANRARLVRLLYRDGVQSRSQLARRLGVSRATVTTIVQPLLEDGVLVELPAAERAERAGKPARPLWFGRTRLIGCVYIAADRVRLAVLTMDGTILRHDHRSISDIGDGTKSDVGDHIIDLCAAYFAGVPLIGIGVAVAGMVDTDDGIVIAVYNLRGLEGLRIGDTLGRRVDVPVVVDHHPRVQAIGDLWFGAGRGMSTFASLYTGEVLGVGIVQGGRIIRGERGAGGEIGHIVIDVDGERCVCGRIGCWETLATLPWLRQEAQRAGLPDAVATSSRTLAATSADDVRADSLLRRYIGNVAQGLADLEQILGLGTYLIHGDVATGGPVVLQMLQEELRRMSPRRGAQPIVSAVLDEDRATLLGAAGLVLSSLYALDAGK